MRREKQDFMGLGTTGVDLRVIAPSDITDALAAIGIREGSVVLVHADAIVAAQFPPMLRTKRLDLLISSIENAIGSSGTLVVPTFSYSFTKAESFDVLNTPSAVGIVSEHFRVLPQVCRSTDPIFSFACRGSRAGDFCELQIQECFGSESMFAALHRANAYIVDLGCSMTRGGTFVHYVETAHGVDYRYNKQFSGTVILPNGQNYECSVVYNVRDLNRKSGADLRRLQERLTGENKLRSVEVGRSRIMCVAANDLFATAWKMLDEDPKSLIAEGAIS